MARTPLCYTVDSNDELILQASHTNTRTLSPHRSHTHTHTRTHTHIESVMGLVQTLVLHINRIIQNNSGAKTPQF